MTDNQEETSLANIAKHIDKSICSDLLVNVFLSANPQLALKGHFKHKADIGHALFYKSALKISLSAYTEMKKHNNGHLEGDRTFMDCIMVVVLAVCSGIAKDNLAKTLLDSKSNKRSEYLNAMWGNYDVILKYVNLVLQDESNTHFRKAARMLQSA